MIRTVVNCGFNSCSLGNLKGSHCSVWQILKKKRKEKRNQLLGFKSHARDFHVTQIRKCNPLAPRVVVRTAHGHVVGFSRSPKSSSGLKFKEIQLVPLLGGQGRFGGVSIRKQPGDPPWGASRSVRWCEGNARQFSFSAKRAGPLGTGQGA